MDDDLFDDFLDLVDLVEAVVDNGEDGMARERREYKMRERIEIDRWDDVDFLFRFRVSKCTFAQILAEVRPALEYTNPR